MISSSITSAPFQGPVGGPRADRRRAVHGRPRHVDRERCAGVDQVQPALFPGEPPVGDHGLRDHVRRVPASGRAPGRRVRPPARVPDRHRRVHDRLGAQRPGLVGSVPGRLPRAARRRRSALRAGRPLAAHDRVPGGTRAQPRPGNLGRRVRKRRGSRCAARRRPDLVPQLAVDLLHQPSRRDCADRPRPPLHRRGSRRARDASLRRGWRDHDHRSADAARLCADARDAGGLGNTDDRDAARRLRHARGRIRRDRALRDVTAPAVPRIPWEHARDRERDHVHHRGDRVLAVLHPDAVPAAGAALLGS